MTTTKDVKTTLTNCLRELRLPTFREHYEGMAQRAMQETLSYEMYLLELAQREYARRLNNRIETMLRQSRLPLEKSLESFQLKCVPSGKSWCVAAGRCTSPRRVCWCKIC